LDERAGKRFGMIKPEDRVPETFSSGPDTSHARLALLLLAGSELLRILLRQLLHVKGFMKFCAALTKALYEVSGGLSMIWIGLRRMSTALAVPR
jgi:hypothetical protein